MNKISRTISGLISVVIGLFIIFNIVNDRPEGWYFVILWALFFIIIGLILFFNKKEDEIEEIKGFNEEK